ncbi:MAG TPA: response regulator [Prolixibacteraceae bacterium]|nr:response regulator [Prolixibacteraceae bacterium]
MNTKLRCLLLDDELPGLAYLKLLCEQMPEVEVVRAFNDPVIFMKEFPVLEFDLCILDIEMPGINGIELAGMLNDKAVIFTTAYKEYATDAFDLNAIDYVIKPVKFERLKQAVNKAVLWLQKQDKVRKHAWLITNKGKTLVYFDQLAYIKTSEVDSRDKIAYLTTHSTLQLKNISFKQLTALLPRDHFCRINKKELIAMNCVHYFSGDQVTTNLQIQDHRPLVLTLGEAFRGEFLQKVNR